MFLYDIGETKCQSINTYGIIKVLPLIFVYNIFKVRRRIEQTFNNTVVSLKQAVFP